MITHIEVRDVKVVNQSGATEALNVLLLKSLVMNERIHQELASNYPGNLYEPTKWQGIIIKSFLHNI